MILAAVFERPLALAAAAWLILRILKVRHPASRHAVWTAVLLGMLLLPVLSVMVPHWSLPLLSSPHFDAPAGVGPAAITAFTPFDPATPPAKNAVTTTPAFAWPTTA